MKKTAVIIFLISLSVAALRADEQVRAVQEQLKNQGFYYGQIDGEPGAETTAAIRRYQIRNGLQVTGTLTQETLDALKAGNAPSAGSEPVPPPSPAPRNTAPPVQPPPDVSENDRDFLRHQGGAVNPPVSQPTPRNPGAVSPPVEMPEQPSALSTQYAVMFARTPYANAPIEVQQQTLKAAQLRLLREHFYDGPVDGIPGVGTVRAITLFQDDSDLPRTGRLDFDTLRVLHLLPVSGRPIVTEPFYPPPDGGVRVYRGIWVR